MAQRIGQLLIEHGVLNEHQVARILEEQRTTHRPFGEIAERLFNIDERAVEDAWAHQYAMLARQVDPTMVKVDPAALALLSPRQAWQFRVLPIGYDGDELTICTAREHLARALRFSMRHLATPCYFVLATSEALGHALVRYYPVGGMSPDLANPVASATNNNQYHTNNTSQRMAG